MIKNLWSYIELYCGNPIHKEPIKLVEKYTPTNTLFFACPKYFAQNREDDEKMCKNSIYTNDYEKAVEEIEKRLVENAKQDIEENLEGLRWTSKNGICYEVFSHSNDKIKIKMINKRAMN